VWLVLAALAFYLWFKPPRWRPGPWELLTLPQVDLSHTRRMLVVSPHCDDETLGAGGLIAAARVRGAAVKVVFATNGDGFRFATAERFHQAFPSAAQYESMGETRQHEAQAALRCLGVSDPVFLGYPDRGVAALWTHYWQRGNPYHSLYTHQTKSPYLNTFNRDAVYCGDDVLADLRRILHDWQPDLIVYPHPNDVHPDHWAVSAFTRLALALERRDEPRYAPDTLTYLVHRPDYPEPRNLHPEAALVPPPPIRDVVPFWLRFDLGEQQRHDKYEAVLEYRSQLPTLKHLMLSFVRRDECFARESAVTLPTLAAGDPKQPDTWRDAGGRAIEPVRRDAVRDGVLKDAFGSADLVALYAARLGDGSLALAAQVRRRPKRTWDYVLRVLTVDTAGQHPYCAARSPVRHAHRARAVANGHFVCCTLPAAAINGCSLMFVSAEVDVISGKAETVQLDMLDQVGWQQVDIPPSHLGHAVSGGVVSGALAGRPHKESDDKSDDTSGDDEE